MNGSTRSYWNLTGQKTSYPPLGESLTTDVLIIGAGITGVTCAYSLAKRGVKPLLIEAGGICDGTTGNTTGKVTLQHGVIYYKLLEKYGRDTIRAYADSQRSAIDFVKTAVREEGIDCQLAENTAYIYAENDIELDTLEREYDAAREAGIEAELMGGADFPPGNHGLLGYRGQFVFHAVRYVNALATAAVRSGARICSDTKAVELDNGDVKTIHCENGIKIRARHVVMATQYPLYDGPNLFFARLYPKRDYGVAVRVKRDWPDGSYINVGKPARSIRTHVENGERILIVVGDDHDTGRGDEDMSKHHKNLLEFADSIAGVDEVLAMWSAQDYDTPDELPYIGRVSDHSDLYIAAGFRKWGLTNGTLSGNMIAELITDGNCRYESLYSRSRPDITSSFGKAVAGAFIPVGELIKSKLEGTREIEGLEPGEGRVIRFKGQRAGVYMDLNGDVTVLDITCTHMGTELNFNSAEKTWDCPAHGGRFNTDGELLEGAPKDSLRVLFRGKFAELAD